MYLNWGFKVLNFNYIQPPLSKNSISEENLLLLYRGEILEKNNLKDFLYYFYKGLNAVFKKWLEGGCEESPEEIEKIIKSEYQGRNI